MNNSRRKTRKRRVKHNLTRRLRTELLETRQLLAADVNPFHNLYRPADVNGDGSTTLSDLRVLFTDISANGTRELSMASPLGEGEPGSQSNNYLDVNADGYVTPADLRYVYNAVLQGEGESDMQLEVFMSVVDVNDNPVTVATVGQTLKLDVDIRDARIADANNSDGSPMWPGLNDSDTNQGVFAAYFDYAHSTNLVNASAPDEFGCNLDLFTQQFQAMCQYDHGDYNSINKSPTGAFPTVDEDVDNVGGDPDKVDVIHALGGTTFQAFQTNRANLVEIIFTVEGTDLTAVNDTAQTDDLTPVAIPVLANDSVVSELFFQRREALGNNTEVSFLRGGTPGDPSEDHLSVITPDEIFGDETVRVPLSGVGLGGLTIVSTSSGTATVNDNNTPGNASDDFIDFTPAVNSPGSVEIVYSITDGLAGTTPVTATATVEVGSNNDAPTHTTPNLSGNEETAIPLTGVSVDDSDAGAGSLTTTVEAFNGTLSATIGGSTQTGALLTINGNLSTINAALQTMSFTGDLDFTGQEVLEIITNDNGNTGDGGAMTTTDAITVTVNNVNDPPIVTAPVDQNIADDDILPFVITVTDVDSTNMSVDLTLTSGTGASGQIGSINVGTTSGVTVTGNDSETVNVFGPLASVQTALASLTYTPDDFSGFLGLVTITADADDQDTGLDSDSFDIEVEPGVLPRARRDTLTVDEDSGSIPANIIDVLANDLTTNTSADARLLSVNQPATGGTVAIIAGSNGDGTDDTVQFTPTADFAGSTSFTYVMDETPDQGGVPSTGTVNVTVREENDAPTAADTTVSFDEDEIISASAFANLLASLPVAPGGGADEASQTLTITSVQALNSGATVSLSGLTLDADYNNDIGGPFRFEYVVTDNGTTNGASDPLSATATVTVNIAAENDKPIAVTETLSADKNGATLTEDTDASISIATLLANDLPGPATATDEAAQSVTFDSLVSTTTSGGGSITVSGTDLIYSPSADFNGSDTFSYTVTDQDLTSDPVTVTLNVSAVNDAPIPNVISADFFDGAVKGVPFTMSVSALLSNDAPGPATATDEANQPLSITAVQNGPDGTVALNGNDVVFTPNPGFSGITTFTYTLFDGQDVNIETATVTLDVADFIPSSFSGHVVVDTNANGMMDVSEQVLGGVNITISGTDLNDDPITPITVQTDSAGFYSFENLTPGSYNITQEQPAFFMDGVEQLGTHGTTSPSNDTFSITIGPAGGIDSEDNNFGEYGLHPDYFSIEELRALLPQNGAIIGLNGSSQQWFATMGSWGSATSGMMVTASIAADMRTVTVSISDGSTTQTESFDSAADSRVSIMGDDGNGGSVIRLHGDISDLFSQAEGEGEGESSTVEEAIEMLAAAHHVADVDALFSQLG